MSPREEESFVIFFHKYRDMLMRSIDETLIHLAWKGFPVLFSCRLWIFIFTKQNNFANQVIIFYLQEKIFKNFYDEDNCTAVHGCLLHYGMSMGKVNKGFSYSFNVFHVSHSSVERGTINIFDLINGVECFKWALFVLICKM